MMNILYTCSDGYAPYMGISMFSLLENNQKAEEITFYVVSDGISEQNIAKLESQISHYGDSRQLVIIDGNAYIEKAEKLHLRMYRGGHAANLRLFFTEYINCEKIDKLLYLDCDSIISGDIQPLFEMDMSEYSVAVVLESLGGTYKDNIGFAPDIPYFNAGMLLFNIQNWKKDKMTEQLFEYMSNPDCNFVNGDQDYMNILLKEKALVLSPKYNLQPLHLVYTNKEYFKCYPEKGYYSVQELAAAVENPVIFHTYRYLGQFPWHKNSHHPLAKEFWDYISRSEWRDMPPKENKGIIFVIERCLYKILPKIAFLQCFSKIQTIYWKMKCKKIQVRRS